jgi:hypothetical protein
MHADFWGGRSAEEIVRAELAGETLGGRTEEERWRSAMGGEGGWAIATSTRTAPRTFPTDDTLRLEREVARRDGALRLLMVQWDIRSGQSSYQKLRRLQRRLMRGSDKRRWEALQSRDDAALALVSADHASALTAVIAELARRMGAEDELAAASDDDEALLALARRVDQLPT